MLTDLPVPGCSASTHGAHLARNASAALLLLASACGRAPHPGVAGPTPLAPPLPGYRLVWHDEFDGTALDTSRWTIYAGPRRHARNAADAVSVAGGALTIVTYSEGGTHFTGFLDTAGKFLVAYGWLEARVRFESSPGEWGAFWLNSPTMGSPVGDPAAAGAEIDVAEHRARDSSGADISDRYGINVHWDGYGADHKHAGGEGAPRAGAAPLHGSWHVYALRWTREAYTFYLDGVEQWTTQSGVSRRPEFIKLSCEVQDSSWAGRVPAAGYGSRASSRTRMQVDWVRVWQEAP